MWVQTANYTPQLEEICLGESIKGSHSRPWNGAFLDAEAAIRGPPSHPSWSSPGFARTVLPLYLFFVLATFPHCLLGLRLHFFVLATFPHRLLGLRLVFTWFTGSSPSLAPPSWPFPKSGT